MVELVLNCRNPLLFDVLFYIVNNGGQILFSISTQLSVYLNGGGDISVNKERRLAIAI